MAEATFPTVPDQPVRLVASVLVRNEDVFVEQAIRNVAPFCDRIHALDHMSQDGTWDILCGLADEYDHLDVQRARRAADSHRSLERYAGTPTWVLGVDGDELFDPAALGRLREALLSGQHADVFRLKAHVLNCEEINARAQTATGWMAPPSRPVTKLFYLGAVEEWAGCSERLHDGHPAFRPGYRLESMRYLSETLSWDDDPLRCLHTCFMRRSSWKTDDGVGRLNIGEGGTYDRSLVGLLKRKLRSPVPKKVAALHRAGTNWKREWYARGERVTVDAGPFIAARF